METITLYPSKLRWIIVGITCGLFLSLSMSLLEQGYSTGALIMLVISGIGLLMAFFQLFTWVSFLRLDADGFECCSFGTSFERSWCEVSDFTVSMQSTGLLNINEMVVFNDEPSEDHMLAGLSRLLVRRTGGLPDTYGMKADALAEMMTQYKQAYDAPRTNMTPRDMD